MKKIIAIALLVILVAGLSIGGTVAYLQDQSSDTNTMTLGNVEIDQIEYERVFAADGTVTAMQEFTQNKPLYPAVIKNGVSANSAWAPNAGVDTMYGDYIPGFPGGNGTWQNLNNVQDKFVFVKNTGNSDAYFRTIILLEADATNTTNSVTGQSMIHLNVNSRFSWENAGDISASTPTVTIDGETYYIVVATYNDVLTAGEVCRPSLLQVGLDQEATNEIVAQFGNTYDIIVLSQAVQAAGFENAAEALDAAFGEVTAENVLAWFE